MSSTQTIEFICYPFGMVMPGRSWTVASGSEYRFGFNGKESDSETYGDNNIYDYGFRIYNPRLGKFLSVDPLTRSYPWYSPYHFAGNDPIRNSDLDGLEEYSRVEYSYQGVVFRTITCRVPYDMRAHEKDDPTERIDEGIFVKKLELTAVQFAAVNVTGFADYPNDEKGDRDYDQDDIIKDPISVLEPFEKTTLDGAKNMKNGGGNKTYIGTPNIPISLNFAPNNASPDVVQSAFDTDPVIMAKIDIMASLVVQFSSGTLTITGTTDADPSPYTSGNPDNPGVGNGPLSYDRANVIGQFIAQRASAISGQPVSTFTNRVTIIGAGISPGASTSDSSEVKASQRKFTFKLTY